MGLTGLRADRGLRKRRGQAERMGLIYINFREYLADRWRKLKCASKIRGDGVRLFRPRRPPMEREKASPRQDPDCAILRH